MNLIAHHTTDANCNKSIHAGRTLLEYNQFILKQLIPNQRIIELMREIILNFYPELEPNSSKYDLGLSNQFSVSFANAVNEFPHEGGGEMDNQYTFVDQDGEMSSSFLISVMHWISVKLIHRDEFHKLLVSCIQEQVGDAPFMITETIGIQKQGGEIILFFRESDEGTSDSVDIEEIKERRGDKVKRLLG